MGCPMSKRSVVIRTGKATGEPRPDYNGAQHTGFRAASEKVKAADKAQNISKKEVTLWNK